MNLDLSEWKRFKMGSLFDIKKGKRLTAEDQTEGDNLYIGAIDSNNGVSNHIGQKPIHKGNTISLSYNGSVGEAFYQPTDYWATDDVNALYSYYDGFNEMIGLFMATVIRQEKCRFSYGRKWTLENMKKTEISLPVKHNPDDSIFIDEQHIYSEDGYVPDWAFMEDYMKSLHHKPLITNNSTSNAPLNVFEWKEFFLKDICVISMGNKMDYAKMTFDEPTINFVGRSAENNGVNGVVDYIDGIEPYKAGCITVALGGSLGSSYIQYKDFYTSQNVSVLEFEDSVDIAAKIFITTTIMNECKYKYFPFGRELNTHIRTDFSFYLPVKHNADGSVFIDEKYTYSDKGYVPDWKFMSDYIKSLPYGDRL